LQTSLQPEELLAACQAVEKELGRDRAAEAAYASAAQEGAGSAGTGVAVAAAQHQAGASGGDGSLGKRTYSSRLIDIDILLYDRLQYRSPTLTVPHPRLRERPFAMALLQEILPKDISLQDFYR
ncbi:MAG: 2-amino-4-hydroxy-6-hydroxymethyldihydropteridine diphosphokinase, partial [Bacteroidales bacterium]